MDRKSPKLYWQLFCSTFMLSAFTFGGGYVIVPLMRKKFVDGLHWLEEEEMLDITAIAQSAPGVIAVNASILVGYRIAGVLGALVTVIGTVLPPLIIISVISLFYTAFRENRVVGAVLKGMQTGVAAVIVDVVLSMGDNILKGRSPAAIATMLLSFVAVAFFGVNVSLIIVICGVCGALHAFWRSRKSKGESAA